MSTILKKKNEDRRKGKRRKERGVTSMSQKIHDHTRINSF